MNFWVPYNAGSFFTEELLFKKHFAPGGWFSWLVGWLGLLSGLLK
jgi:hypothetical protein